MKILVVQTAFAGDVVLVTPLIRAVREAHPEAAIDVMLTPETAVLFENNPHVRSVLVYDKRKLDRGILSLYRWVKKVRQNRYDMALVPHRSLRSAVLVYLAGIERRIGFDRSAGSFLFTERVLYSGEAHEVERNLRLLQRAGWSRPVPGPELFPGPKEKDAVTRFLSENGIGSDENLLAMAPGSLWTTKRWPAERFGEVAGRLHRKLGTRTLLIGGKKDAGLADAVLVRSAGGVVNAMGRFSLLESAELIRRCRVLLSNDSAPMHLAAAVGTRAAAIFGPTVPAFGFAPYGNGHLIIEKELECRPCSIHGGQKCPKGHFRCMLDLSADEVADTMERFFEPL